MTIEETRAQAVVKLGELQTVQSPRYTARDLHQRRAMLARVQRQEQRRYMKQVISQKTKLKKDISDIDTYLSSVNDYNVYLASLPKKNGNGMNGMKPVIKRVPVFLPTPQIVFGQKPILKRTRLYGYKRRSKY